MTPLASNALEALQDILADPSDRKTSLRVERPADGRLTLVGARGRQFSVENGIVDLFCPELDPPSHYPKDDPDWEVWDQLQTKLFTDYTYSGGLTGWIQKLGHRAAAACAPRSSSTVLEIGSGTSHHLINHHEAYSGSRYINLDVRPRHLLAATRECNRTIPDTVVPYFIRGSAYRLPFRANSIDHVVAIYVFEHLYHLDLALSELARVLTASGSWFLALPTEGGLAWSVGRRLTFSRQIRKQHGIDYDRIMSIEHCNSGLDVLRALRSGLTVSRVRYLPFRVPTIHANAVLSISGTNRRSDAGRLNDYQQ